jgi:hypothetical protein
LDNPVYEATMLCSITISLRQFAPWNDLHAIPIILRKRIEVMKPRLAIDLRFSAR